MADLLPLSLSLTGWLLTYLAHSTVVLALVWIAHRLGWIRAPESGDMIWKLALLAGVVTATGATLPSAVVQKRSIDVVAQVERREIVGDVRAGMSPAAGWMTHFDGPELSVSAEVVSPTPECRAALERGPIGGPGWAAKLGEACAPPPRVACYHLLLLAWLGGAFWAGIRFLAARRALRTLRTRLGPADPAVAASFADLADRSGVRATLRVSDELEAPCVIDRRTVVLPIRCQRELAPDELRAVMAHELAHVGRHDVAWLGLARLVAGVMWIQPLNRIAVRRMQEAAELVCDDWALERTGQRLGLARSISRVAEWALASRRAPLHAVAMGSSDGRSLSYRVRRILTRSGDNGGGRRSLRLAAAMVLLLPVMALPSVPRPATMHAAVFVGDEAAVAGGIERVRLHALDDAAPVRIRIRGTEEALEREGARVYMRRMLESVEVDGS